MAACLFGERCEALPSVPLNPAVNTDAPSVALRASRGSPVTLVR